MIPTFIMAAENEKRRKQNEQSDARAGIEVEQYELFDDDDFGVDEDADEPVLQSKGGGTVQPTDPMKEAQAQIAVDNASWERQQQLAAQQAAEEKRAEEQLKQDALTAQWKAYRSASDYGKSMIDSLGYEDTYGIGDAYRREINRINSNMPSTEINAGTYYGDDIFDDIISDITTRERNSYTNQFNSTYAPGFSYDTFGDTYDDDIINQILDSRIADAQATLDRAYARGKVNDVGYDSMLSGLTEQRSTANSTLQGLGGGVLAGYRSNLESLADTTRNQIGSYTLGGYDPIAGFQSRLDNKIAGYNNTLEGDILAALGDTALFDTSSLLSKAGASQGVTNSAGSFVRSLDGTQDENANQQSNKKRTATMEGTF